MSVIVMGMEMPDCCEKCPFLDYEQGYCFASGKKQKDGWYDCNLYVSDSDNEKRHKDCPLKDTLDYYIREAGWDAKTNRVLGWVKDDFIDSEPTIVEAEGE